MADAKHGPCGTSSTDGAGASDDEWHVARTAAQPILGGDTHLSALSLRLIFRGCD